MKNKQIQFLAECKQVNQEERSLVAYVSTNDVDRYQEIVLPASFELGSYRKNPVVLWAHDYTMPPIAKALWIKPDEVGLLAKVSFAKTQFADEIFGLYRDGFMRAFSIGFIPKEYHEEKKAIKREDGTEEIKSIIVYDRVELLEFSAVPVPANQEALALAVQKGAVKSERLALDLHIELPAAEADAEGTKKALVEMSPEEIQEANAKLQDEIGTQTRALAEKDDVIAEKDKEIAELKAKLGAALKEAEDLKAEVTKLKTPPPAPKERTIADMTAKELTERISKGISGAMSGVRKHRA